MFIGYKYILTGGSGDFQIPGMSSVTETAQKGVTGLGNALPAEDVTVYQWVDDKGVTHFGGTPPTGQGSYDKKEIRANTNLLNAYKAPEVEEKPAQRSRVSSVGNLYSPEGVKNLMDDAKGASDQINNRAADQQKMLDNLLGKQSSK